MSKISLSVLISLSTVYSWGMFDSTKQFINEFRQLFREYRPEETGLVRERINNLSFQFMKNQKLDENQSNWIRSPFLHARSMAAYVLATSDEDYKEFLNQTIGLEEEKKQFAAYGVKHIIDAEWGKGMNTHFSLWLKTRLPYFGYYHYLNQKYTKAFLGHVDNLETISSIPSNTKDPISLGDVINTDNEINLENPIHWASQACPELSMISQEYLPEGPFYTLGVQHIAIPWVYGAKENGLMEFDTPKERKMVPTLRIPTPISVKKIDTELVCVIPLFNSENENDENENIKNPLIFIGIMPESGTSINDVINKVSMEYAKNILSELKQCKAQKIDLILPRYSFDYIFKFTTENDLFELKTLSKNLPPQKAQVLHQIKVDMIEQAPLTDSFPFDKNQEEIIFNRPFIWLVYSPELDFIFAYGACYDPSKDKAYEVDKSK